MTACVSRRRRSRFGLGQYALTWLIPAGIIAVVMLAIWPLLAFRHHWTTVAQVPCFQDMSLPGCANVQFGDVITAGTQVQQHSGPTGLGAGLTVAWIGLWVALVMYGSITGRRQKARRGGGRAPRR